MMAACIRASRCYKLALGCALRQQASPTVPSVSIPMHVLKQHSRGYSGPSGKITGWVKRKLLTVLAVAGLSGGALVIVSIAVMPW